MRTDNVLSYYYNQRMECDIDEKEYMVTYNADDIDLVFSSEFSRL
jgi:hypothetical protein